MARSAGDAYGSGGSVPNQVAVDGSGARPMGVQATPADMGMAIGKGIETVGNAADKISAEYGGMINETLLTNADAALAKRVGELKGAYLQNTGLAAASAFPKYQAALEDARQQARAGLPMGAQHGFDMLATRTIANHMADGSTYAASQIRQANIDAGTSLSNANVQAVLDPDIAKDPERVKWHQDSAIHGLQMGLDESHPGLKTGEDGTINFDESTQEGRDLKAQYQAGVDNIIAKTQVNRFQTLAKGDVLGAFGIYQKERDTLPKPAQVELDSMFEPKVFHAHVQNGSASVMAHTDQEYSKVLYNPSSAGSNANNLGNVKTASGAAGNTQDFVTPATPVDGVILTANNLRGKNYTGKTLEQIGHTWTSTDPDAWVKNVSSVSGIDPKTVPDLNDPVTLHKMMEGIATAEKSPKDRAIFTDEVISDGVKKSLAGEQHNSIAAQQPKKSYATNEDGTKMTQADYYSTHSQDVIDRADALAEQQMPGDLAYKRAMRESVSGYMSKVISNQSHQYIMDNKNVIRGINGEFSKGQVPQTEDDLRAIPGMGDLLDRVATQDPRFAASIPTILAKVARRNDTVNSQNGYDTILRALEPNSLSYPNRIGSTDHLAKLLGRNDPTGINMKDYSDAKKVIEAGPEFENAKETLSKTMQEISAANGNLDGKGQERAVQWYNQVMAAKDKNDKLGDKKLPDEQVIAGVSLPEAYPSRIQQIENLAKQLFKERPSAVRVTSPDGKTGTIPSDQLDEAIKAGYKKVE